MPNSSALPTFSGIYAFGDSLSDAGNLSITTQAIGQTTPVAPPYFQEQYGSNTGNVFSNGPVWVQNLSVGLGLGTPAPSVIGGTDFAYGGAQTGPTPQNQNLSDVGIQAVSLPTQFTQFQTAVSNPSSSALYTLSIGSNDLLAILSSSGLSAAQQVADINASVANEITFVKQLVAVGAKNLLVMDVPDIGKAPAVTGGLDNGGNTPAEVSQLTGEYNSALVTQLAVLASADALNVKVVDAYQLTDAAVANPSAYGLTNVTTPVWSGNYTSDTSGTLATTSVAAQNQYLFWDGLHPTETGHQGLTTVAEQELSGNRGAGLAIQDTTTGQPLPSSAALPYIGPVSGLQDQYINITTDNLNISAASPNWFIHSGSGFDAIAVSSGTNVLDGGTGSNFLTGGSGTDTFFVDDRNANGGGIWSTMNNFHAGDAATIWGISPGDFNVAWANGQGAAGYTGLTLHATSAEAPTASLTLVGYSQGDLSDGRLSVSFGTVEGNNYMYIHANS